jgi:enoyl-CoA hydratase/carnithine racemase
MPGRVRVERDGQLGWIVFDHPERRNAITAQMWRDIPAAAEQLDRDPGIRVILLRGAGEVAFVSGADISEFDAERSGAGAEQYDQENGRAFAALSGIAKPLIALIHGFCIGGGCAISLTADVRYAADDAVFGIPAARLGLGYAAGGLDALVRTVGFPSAKELFFTGRRFDAREAHHMGLVNRVFAKAELDAGVGKIAESIASNAPLTLRSAKLIFGQLAQEPAHRDADAIARSIRACYESGDYRRGVQAFLEKRRPDFSGS